MLWLVAVSALLTAAAAADCSSKLPAETVVASAVLKDDKLQHEPGVYAGAKQSCSRQKFSILVQHPPMCGAPASTDSTMSFWADVHFINLT